MAAITVNLPDELEKEFRKLTTKKFGDKQGKLTKGAIEALIAWCKKQE